MSIVRSSAKGRLRFNHRSGNDGTRRLSGLVLESRIPGGVGVYINVDQPTALLQSDDAQRNGTVFPAQPFVIERASRPQVTAVAGGTFIRRIRTLSVTPFATGFGEFKVAQVMPAFVDATPTPTPPVTGLVPKGRYDGFIPSWVYDSNGEVLSSGEILRLRWLGTPVAAEIVDAGSNTGFTVTLVNPENIAPGSVAITATIGGNAFVIRDTGDGRLVGQEPVSGDTANGTIDYLTGVVTLEFSTATDAVNITADYEHACLYLPLDINIEWDAKMADG